MTAPAANQGAADGIWWRFPDRPGTIEELNPAEYRRLLASVSIGRLGYTGEKGPRITPVTFLLDGDAITFRTGRQSEVARLALEEVQQLEPRRTPQPWAQGERTLVCQVALGQVTGRRVQPG